MLVLTFAALIFAAAAANASPALGSASPWWEKITYTISGDGAQQSCRYQTSASGAETCDPEHASSPIESAGSGTVGSYTKITIERRFTPGSQPDPVSLESGDTLLGRQVMALAIDEAGAVRNCKIVLATGDVRPEYGCKEAGAERFEASARRSEPEVRQGFLTILIYGHEEYLT